MNSSADIKVATLTGISRSAGGLYYAVSSLCKALDLHGVQMSVYGRADSHVEADLPAWDPVPVMPYKATGPLGSSLGLRRLLLKANVDLVHQHGLWLDDQWASLHWHGKTGKPVVVSPHGMLDPWALRNSAWKKKLVGRLFANESLAKASCIHALCDSEADSIRKHGLRNPIAVIPNGVDLPEIGVGKKKGRGRKHLLFLGRIHPKKGLVGLLSGWVEAQQASKAVGEWQLLISGWDDRGHLKELKQAADEVGLKWADISEKRGLSSLGEPGGDGFLPGFEDCPVLFLGPVFGRDKDCLMRNVDGFVLPSFSEGLPVAVLEAWSYALPVMMTAFCNIPEGFSAGAAMKVDPDAESIARGLGQWVAMEPSELVEMGSLGRALVEKKFTWEKIARDMKAIYEDCVASRGMAN